MRGESAPRPGPGGEGGEDATACGVTADGVGANTTAGPVLGRSGLSFGSMGDVCASTWTGGRGILRSAGLAEDSSFLHFRVYGGRLTWTP